MTRTELLEAARKRVRAGIEMLNLSFAEIADAAKVRRSSVAKLYAADWQTNHGKGRITNRELRALVEIEDGNALDAGSGQRPPDDARAPSST